MLNYGDILYQNGMIDSNGSKKKMKKMPLKALFHIDHLILTLCSRTTGSTNYYNSLMVDKDDFSVVDEFMNRPDVKRAINVGTVEFQSNEFNNVHLREEDRKVEFNLKRDI